MSFVSNSLITKEAPLRPGGDMVINVDSVNDGYVKITLVPKDISFYVKGKSLVSAINRCLEVMDEIDEDSLEEKARKKYHSLDPCERWG